MRYVAYRQLQKWHQFVRSGEGSWHLSKVSMVHGSPHSLRSLLWFLREVIRPRGSGRNFHRREGQEHARCAAPPSHYWYWREKQNRCNGDRGARRERSYPCNFPTQKKR